MVAKRQTDLVEALRGDVMPIRRAERVDLSEAEEGIVLTFATSEPNGE